MKPTNEGEATPAEISLLDASRERLVQLQKADSVRYAEEMQLLHEASRLAGDIATRGSKDSRESELAHRSISAEFSTPLRISDRTMQRRMALADTLVQDFSGTFAALKETRIFRGHVSVILDAGAHLPDAQSRAAYEEAVLPLAEREAPSRVRPYARLVAERLHPRSLKERHAEAAACRGVWTRELPDGMSQLTAIIPTVAANGILDRLNQFADSATAAADESVADESAAGGGFGPGAVVADTRTKDQRRADAFADIGLTGDPAAHAGPVGVQAIVPRVQLQISMLSLMGLADTPAIVDGLAPVDAETARILAGAASGWDRVLTHPITGAVLAVDRYTPTAELKRTLRVRDQHCRFPGCRQPVSRCDLDHTYPHALGGETCDSNLAHLCRRHHVLKHATAWSVVQLPGGILEWTSPTGQLYRDIPTSSVLFEPDADWNDAFANANANAAANAKVAATATATANANANANANAGFDSGEDDPPPF